MNTNQARYGLTALKNKYLLLKLVEAMLLSGGIGILAYTLAGLFIISNPTKIIIAVATGLIILLVRVLSQNLHRFSDYNVIQFVNAHYLNLQESADLLLRDDDTLTQLQRLQKERVVSQFSSLYPSIKLPHRIGQALVVLVLCSGAYVGLSGFAITQRDHASQNKPAQEKIEPITGPALVSVEKLDIKVTPPSYTQRATFVPQTFSLTMPEGSVVSWEATFSGSVENPMLIFRGIDSARMNKKTETTYTFTQQVTTSGFYQLQWSDESKTHLSDFYKIDIIKDQPPKVTVTNLEQFTELEHSNKMDIDVTSSLSDDYSLRDAKIIATVSKGSGEGVKFREETIRFTTPKEISGKQVTAKTSFNLKKLGLEPGDELYFYVEAFDNKTPVPNRNRTETFFIALKDTASYAMVADEGLGVDLMPEYFRSQRQIIIDTEKLLRQQKLKQMSKQQFNATSNELGYDQKVLRLRYGQFLGEEADSGIPHSHDEEEEDHIDTEKKEVDPTKALAHEHDTKNEHNLVGEKKSNDHKESTGLPDEKEEDPLKAFVHEHDNQEEATFFIASVKTKLKMALSIMWDAELHLRLFDPAKSLPYQYKVLNLLKEISNDSRIYVHRMGFDPPPLKEEKRLTADLTEIKNSTNQYAITDEKRFVAVRSALQILEQLISTHKTTLTDEQKGVFTKAGVELAAVVISEPGSSLKSLSLIRNLIDGNIAAKKVNASLLELRKEFWNLLPHEALPANKVQGTPHSLDNKFLQQLETLKHE